MSRLAAALGTVVAVTIGALLAPSAAPSLTQAEAARSWAAANGLILERSTPLTADGLYQRHYFAGRDACRLSVAPLGAADESLAEFFAHMSDQEREEARLLVNGLSPMPKSAIRIHLRLLAARLFEGRAPQPAMVIGAPTCLTGADGRALTPWPSY